MGVILEDLGANRVAKLLKLIGYLITPLCMFENSQYIYYVLHM